MKNLIIILLFYYPLYMLVDIGSEQSTKANAGNMMTPQTMIEEGRSMLKEGDLVVRLSREPSSRFIKNFNRHDKSYSHSGIVLFENGYPYVFHIVSGDENPDEKLRKDSLCRFSNPGNNIAYGIFRYAITSDEIKKLKAIIHRFYSNGVRFDHAINLGSNDKMYCSEMISKALSEATGQRIMIKTTKLTTPEATFLSAYAHLPLHYTSNLSIVAIDDLYTNPFCHPIKEYNYYKPYSSLIAYSQNN